MSVFKDDIKLQTIIILVLLFFIAIGLTLYLSYDNNKLRERMDKVEYLGVKLNNSEIKIETYEQLIYDKLLINDCSIPSRIDNGKIRLSESNFIDKEGNKIKSKYIYLGIDSGDYYLSNIKCCGSMRPTIDNNHTMIMKKMNSNTTEKDIQVCDVIAFRENKEDEGLIAHRIIEKGEDERGVYFITQGDHTKSSDGKIRFKQIYSILVGVLY